MIAGEEDLLARLRGRVPPLQRLTRPEHLEEIRFTDGVALVEVDADLLPGIRFKNARREDDPRLRRFR